MTEARRVDKFIIALGWGPTRADAIPMKSREDIAERAKRIVRCGSMKRLWMEWNGKESIGLPVK
jgi:hypothetical protein